MARRARHSSPGAIYHVMIRGNNGQSIFSSDVDRSRFCLLMQEGVERYGYRILAFCFMSNHVHLALQLGDVSLSKICQNLSFRYTKFYNRKHKTIGHLFQGRFRSILVDGNNYLRKLIRYIHLNPVRAKIVDDPLHFPWSSHQAYLMQKEFTWLARDAGLQFFGDSRHEALERYHSFVLAGIGLDDGIDFKKGMATGVIGDDLFIESVRQESGSPNASEDKLLEVSLTQLLEAVADWYKIKVETFPVLGNDRKASRIRAVAAHLARSIQGVSLKEVADVCCRAANSMSQVATSLEAQMLKSERLKSEVGDLKAKLISTVRNSSDAPNQKCEA
jgi:putative transposase